MTEPPRSTMGLWVVYPDPSDPPEVRRAFGYENIVLKRRARIWLAATGISGKALDSAVEDARMAYHAAKPTYRQICDARDARMRWEAERAWDAGERERGGMTRPEWELLREHFAGANDPVAQSILAKAAAALS